MQNLEQPSKRKFSTQPLDRVAIALMAALAILIGILLISGDHTSPRVRSFSWDGRQVGAEDRAFILTFSRPMNKASVEQNLTVEPPLPGKTSWAGRRMAYTLELPAPYGTTFQVKLQGARDRFSQPNDDRAMQPFVGTFRTRDRAFVYLGASGEEAGRLMLVNLTSGAKPQPLTPKNLVVMDFEPYPNGDRLLFSATDRSAVQQGTLDQKLYTVTTGIVPKAPAASPTEARAAEDSPAQEPQAAGVITQLLDSNDYQNLKFDLSPDGQKIVVQRVNRADPADFGLWVVQPDGQAAPLKTEPGGDFLIAPDSNSLAMSQGQGLAILPLESDAEPLDFLGKFGVILAFSKDGTQAATVQFNADPQNPSRSLYLVTNQGAETELLKTDGSILKAQFDPLNRVLYALVTKRIPSDEVFLEEPYIIGINLTTKKTVELLKLPMQREIQMSLAPDGLGLIFDQVVSSTGDSGLLQGEDGGFIQDSRLWFLPLALGDDNTPQLAQPQALPLQGLRPRWLP